MKKILATLNRCKDLHLKKAEALMATLNAFNLFLEFNMNIKFFHRDIRGGNERPTIILATYDKPIKHPDFQKVFEDHADYVWFRDNLVTIGEYILKPYGNEKTKYYFYIQSNVDLFRNFNEDLLSIEKTLYARMKNEYFPHVKKYMDYFRNL